MRNATSQRRKIAPLNTPKRGQGNALPDRTNKADKDVGLFFARGTPLRLRLSEK
jgi:hypothetical protein